MRLGADYYHPIDPNTGEPTHTFVPVYTEMIWQITRDYGGLPDVRTLKVSEIRFFYDGLRQELKACTKPR